MQIVILIVMIVATLSAFCAGGYMFFVPAHKARIKAAPWAGAVCAAIGLWAWLALPFA